MVLTIGMTSFSGIRPAFDAKVVNAGAVVDAGGLGLVGTLCTGISWLVNSGTVCGGRSVDGSCEDKLDVAPGRRVVDFKNGGI